MSDGQVIQAVKGWVPKRRATIYSRDENDHWWEADVATSDGVYTRRRKVAVVVLDWSLWERVREGIE